MRSLKKIAVLLALVLCFTLVTSTINYEVFATEGEGAPTPGDEGNGGTPTIPTTGGGSINDPTTGENPKNPNNSNLDGEDEVNRDQELDRLTIDN